MKSLKNYFILFFILTTIQAMVIAYWGNQKENLYWDEFYTLERAHYFSDSNPEEHYIDEDPDYKVGEWMPISFVKDTLIVGKKESLFNEPLRDIVHQLSGTLNYSAYLNLLESIISSGRFSIWPSIILNIAFFVLNQIILFALSKRVSNNELFSILTCAMYGFCSMCVSMAIFIRFYMLATLFVTAFTYFHILYYENNSEIKQAIISVVSLAISFASLYWAYNNAQYVVVYGGIFAVVFSILILVKKGLLRFLIYALPVFGGGFYYIYTRTEYIDLIFNMSNMYEKVGSATANTLDGILTFKISLLLPRVLDMAHVVGKYLFGSYFVMLLFILIVLVMAIKYKVNGNGEKKCNIFSPFIIVSSVAALSYIVLFTAFGLYTQVRYISFVFPEIALFVMAIAYKTFKNDKCRYLFMIGLVIAVILGVNIKGKVDMLYTGDEESINRIRDFGADSYLLDSGHHRTFITYETAFVAEDDDEFFVYDDLEEGSLDNLKNHLRDKMILVGYAGVSTLDLQNWLRSNGYQVDWIADTYNYVFFTVVRK